MTNSERMANILKRGGLTFTDCSVYGSQCVIDTGKRSRDQIVSTLTSAGYTLKLEKSGMHIDGKNCLRLWFTLE